MNKYTVERSPMFEACVLGPADGSARSIMFQGDRATAEFVAARLNGPVVRFLVHTVSSNPDSSGNSYHWARITSTLSGRSLVMLDTTKSNGRIMARRGCELLGLHGWSPEVEETDATLPKRQWSASIPKNGLYDHLVTARMIADLEQPEPSQEQ